MSRRLLSQGPDCRRRSFLQMGTAGLLGLSLADALRQEAQAAPSPRKAKADSVVMLWLGGGPATIDMWDLKPQAPAGIRGEFKPIQTRASGVMICEHLPKVAEVMDRSLLIRSLSHEITAHGPGTVYMATGHTPSPAVEHPSLGSLAAKVLSPRSGVPPYVLFREAGLAAGAGYLGASYGPFVAASPGRGAPHLEGLALPRGFSVGQLEDRARLRDRFDSFGRALDDADVATSLDRFQQQALDILLSDKTRKALDIEQEQPALRETYGATPLGQSALAARRLVEAGARFVTIGLSGWDTHAGNFSTLRNQLLPQIDRALAALIGDLHVRGLLDTTMVYCAGEFARTPRVNGAAGRDHWARAMSVFLAGGPLRAGLAYGESDEHAAAPARDPISPTDVAATVFEGLGIAPFDQIETHSGRRLSIFREGTVINKIIG